MDEIQLAERFKSYNLKANDELIFDVDTGKEADEKEISF